MRKSPKRVDVALPGVHAQTEEAGTELVMHQPPPPSAPFPPAG